MDAGDAYTTNTCPLSTEMIGLCYQAASLSLLLRVQGSGLKQGHPTLGTETDGQSTLSTTVLA